MYVCMHVCIGVRGLKAPRKHVSESPKPNVRPTLRAGCYVSRTHQAVVGGGRDSVVRDWYNHSAVGTLGGSIGLGLEAACATAQLKMGSC